MHKQVFTKVNILVDEDIKDLIDALSLFPSLETIESCQKRPNGNAIVYFDYGGSRNWKELSEFVLKYLGPALVSNLGDLINISITMNFEFYHCDLVIRPGAMHKVIKIIKKLHKKMKVNEFKIRRKT